jgi:hypothetical protein
MPKIYDNIKLHLNAGLLDNWESAESDNQHKSKFRQWFRQLVNNKIRTR